MMKNWKPLLTIICLTWFIFGVFTFSKIGYQYVGKSYFQSEKFQHELDNFLAEIGNARVKYTNRRGIEEQDYSFAK
ncbi:hypothetical protein LSPH26S_00855 [Lysinibacillus sphaericus]